ncbi:unnamed protein product [Staurois parvus]|uniref:Uncharacterized protein n=1 Tax=Staurois parvus TaxID=386267 RepID=A0ABN9A8T3_9NEOB|nr:unnamed protein product [Staurois parvus]
MPHLSSGHPPPRDQSSPLIGRRNCNSGEAHRRPITGKEVELGEEEPSGTAKIERVKRRRAAGGRRKTADRKRASEPRLEQGSAR